MTDTTVTSVRERKKPRRLRAALIVAGLATVVGAGAADWGWTGPAPAWQPPVQQIQTVQTVPGNWVCYSSGCYDPAYDYGK
ncbi:hypothetical protein BX265_6862 [Streptomyces sp. TLI_235]|nr:hypothetical protein [Streptomyces sp. TLI_235]PBC66323.1 hypothetical protein BX265_8392 [Streptomyces sp. TLI_235]PBC69534.1 hypothetical protein BX265_6862 [Streptomyces sp. TLI_235]